MGKTSKRKATSKVFDSRPYASGKERETNSAGSANKTKPDLYEQSRATRALAAFKRLRSDEPPLGILIPDEESWITKAFSHLKRIDEQRATGQPGDNPFCIFEVGDLYVQFLAPYDSRQLVCETVSAQFSPEVARILTPEKEKLLFGFGFEPVGISPNYSQQIDINSDEDLGYAARLAFRVLKQIYGVKNFGSGTLKLKRQSADTPKVKRKLTIDKQPQIVEPTEFDSRLYALPNRMEVLDNVYGDTRAPLPSMQLWEVEDGPVVIEAPSGDSRIFLRGKWAGMDTWEAIFEGIPMSYMMFAEKWPGLVSVDEYLASFTAGKKE